MNNNERSVAAYLWLIGWLAVGGWFLFDALPPSSADVQASATAPQKSLPIEQITVGRRVAAGNPSGEEDLQFGRHVDPATWKKLTLQAPKQDGSLADVVLLRPDAWLAAHDARVGETVEISVPECGIDGHARVLAIASCPPIADGNGQVVTGTFRHHSVAVIDVAVTGEEEPIGTTVNHPFWSEDKQTFVRADQLQPGETLRTLGGLTTVASITPRAGPEPVYNIEVAVAHTYHVGDGGVLVHNGGGLPGVLTKCFDPGALSSYVDFSPKQLERKWKHAPDFGITTPKRNPTTLLEFEKALKTHMDDPATVVRGTYLYEEGSAVFYNTKTHLVVIVNKAREFVSGWKLNPGTKQYVKLMTDGVLR